MDKKPPHTELLIGPGLLHLVVSPVPARYQSRELDDYAKESPETGQETRRGTVCAMTVGIGKILVNSSRMIEHRQPSCPAPDKTGSPLQLGIPYITPPKLISLGGVI